MSVRLLGIITSMLVTCVSFAAEIETVSAKTYSHRLFQRIAGVPILPTDTRLAEMEKLITAGDLQAAAAVATEDSAFLRTTIKDWAAVMSNRDETPFTEFDDFQALIMGVVRDNLDARELLTGNYRYEARTGLVTSLVARQSNVHYQQFEANRRDPKTDLVRRSPQWDDIPEAAGLLTTRGWAKAHLVAGTNRRAVEFTFREFMCAPIQQWRDIRVPDVRVRRDVDRRPGGEAATYQNTCRGCHGPMDAMAGAFANLDFENEVFNHLGTRVASKMNQNANVFPNGFATSDTTWYNLANQHHNEGFGWRGNQEGVGVAQFGAMIANSRGFSQCMTVRVFKKICRRDPDAMEMKDIIAPATDGFESGGYKLRALFHKISTEPACLGLKPERG